MVTGNRVSISRWEWPLQRIEAVAGSRVGEGCTHHGWPVVDSFTVVTR